MKHSIRATIFFIVLFLMTIPANGKSDNLEAFYSKYIDRYIEKCVIKDKQLSNACMPTVTQYAAVNCMRAAFVAFYKKGIVSSLIENKVGKKDYKIRQHVNSIFLEVFRRAIGDIKEAEELMYRAREAREEKDKQ